MAAGWALLHSLWQGAALALALATLLLAVRSPRVRYVAACAALPLTLGCFGITMQRLMPESRPDVRITRSAAVARVDVADPVDVPNAAALEVMVPWLSMFWLGGVCVFYLRHLAGWASVGRLRRRGVCAADTLWQHRLDQLSATLRVSQPVRLLESCFVDAPIVLGHLRPVILLPIGLLTGLPAAQIEAILLHELAHVRRHDYLVNLVQRLVEGLFFYHPAVWWISHVIRTERENCCDDLAVAMSGDAHLYASALAVLEANRQSANRELALAATGGSVVKRMQRLLYPKCTAAAKESWAPFVMTVILMTTATLALPAWQTAAPAVTPYTKWVNEDVVYIITAQERAAFLNLTTDPERNHFIEQFWLQRDPTPGTPENEMKEEHYRRIAYSNNRFAESVAGWQTDRGRIYIVYGPPDEIESHPSGGERRNPWEDWMYHYIGGVGKRVIVTFVKETGDYRQTRDPH